MCCRLFMKEQDLIAWTCISSGETDRISQKDTGLNLNFCHLYFTLTFLEADVHWTLSRKVGEVSKSDNVWLRELPLDDSDWYFTNFPISPSASCCLQTIIQILKLNAVLPKFHLTLQYIPHTLFDLLKVYLLKAYTRKKKFIRVGHEHKNIEYLECWCGIGKNFAGEMKKCIILTCGVARTLLKGPSHDHIELFTTKKLFFSGRRHLIFKFILSSVSNNFEGSCSNCTV